VTVIPFDGVSSTTGILDRAGRYGPLMDRDALV